jgi:hypothetical protein
LIFYWMKLALRRVVWLFRMPTKEHLAYVDPGTRCPSCGVSRLHPIRCVQRKDAKGNVLFFVQHTCAVDGARWYEETVAKLKPELAEQALARTDLERTDDYLIAIRQQENAERGMAN